MSAPAIRVEHLAKQYRLGELVSRYDYRTLRETLAGLAAAPFRRRRAPAGEQLWALRDVSFSIAPGETVGIIGRNGAGKSTLLKVLSRITEPTAGRVEIRGRVASLLEVGTGFHPELTGRENIYLNGAILGMTRGEIQRKFDQIVAFAEMERFLDTPVKRFSSGMYLRLAFAVAAHLEPEILVVDEVLAVGDYAFQKKCLGQMENVASQGRTVLFVSHNLPVMRRLCTRGLLLEGGTVAAAGPIDAVADRYVRALQQQEEVCFAERAAAPVQLLRLCLRNARGEKASRVAQSEGFRVEIEYVVRERLGADRLWWSLLRADGEYLVVSGELDAPRPPAVREPGRYLATVAFPGGVLNAGSYQYRVSIASGSGVVRDHQEGAGFEIEDDTDMALKSGGRRLGTLLMQLDWQETKLE